MTEEDDKGYRWETEYEKTWEALQEDDEGSLQPSINDMLHKAKRRKLLEKITNVRLGMMRHMFIIIDMSVSMDDQDLKPTRLVCSLKLLEHFIEEYFDQNPISQLGIIVTKNKRAEKVTELGGNPRRHITALQKLKERTCQGEPSLQNSLELAMQTLRHMPSHASREVLVLFGSLTTCDPGDILETLKLLKETHIRCSMIGLAAEVRICKKLCSDTNGKYTVILDESHFKDLLNQHTSPPPAMMNTESSLIRMGFPHHHLGGDRSGDKPSMCMCHLDSKSVEGFSTTGYFCPQCKSKYCELPVECKACGLTLVSAPHLARSYHHLFPLDQSQEIPVTDFDPGQNIYCFACQIQIQDQTVYQCRKCKRIFCIDCDIFVHETLHSCPGCASSRKTQTAEAVFT
ncbi:general transcription factor IIH subunit 2-like [Mercenaria mercenaria]|uniref:general transcription factor IIH subunit 2-like n=1 Tax=Mercenaria mercenaria TaxID=6596 RepID=UPI001E1E04E5|nr:general transcription factor IIH subunit 2-like [Mercenaria mercenaria]